MIHEVIPMQMEGSLPDSRLITYIQDDSDGMLIRRRPLVLLCPGGGYAYTSDREAEPIALAFLAMGYHAAVLRYSCAPAVYPTALTELAYSVKYLRDRAEEWNIDPKKIIVQGCSAGGHLAACLGCFWSGDFLAGELKRQLEAGKTGGLDIPSAADLQRQIKPNAMILCYPVITSGEFAHRGSFQNLLGDREAELGAKMSLEHQINADTPPTFIWGTYTDVSVPVENSILLLSALRKAGVSAEYHLFAEGSHGLALASKLTQSSDGKHLQEECAVWTNLAHTWLERLFA